MPAAGAPVSRLARIGAALLSLAITASVAIPAVAASPEPSPVASPEPSPGAALASVAPDCPPPTAGASASPSPSPSASPSPVAPAATAPAASPLASATPCPDASPAPRPVLTPIPIVPAIPSPSPAASPGPSPSPSPTASPRAIRPGGVRARLDVPISKRLPCSEFPRDGCVNRVDIYHPRNRGDWPTVVTIHGRPRSPSDMRELARALAADGAVVFNADYRGVRPVSKGFPESINDVACAIRYARANTARYGGDPDHIVLVGHSYGGYVGMMVAIAGNRFAGKGIGCLEDHGSSLPDGFVHVAGVSITKASEPLDAIYFGGAYSAIPEVWRRGDVFHQIDLGGNRRLKVGIIFELHDPFLGYAHATWLRNELKEEGYNVRMVLLEEGRTHFDVLDMDTRLGQRVLDFVERLIRRTTPRATASPGR